MKTICTWLAILASLLFADEGRAQYTLLYTTNLPSATNAGGIMLTGFTGTPVNVSVPNFVTSIGFAAFQNASNLVSITIPDSVTNIGQDAFFSCTNLVNVSLGNGVALIQLYAFAYCYNLADVTIPGSVATIQPYAFFESGLTNLTISPGVGIIGSAAFGNCMGLTSAAIPASVTNMTLPFIDVPPSPIFSTCTNVTNISVDPQNPAFASVNGVVFNKALTTLMAYPSGRAGNYVVPNSVSTIAIAAFAGCPNLTSMIIPGNVTNIEIGAFEYSPGLSSVLLTSNAPSMATEVQFDNDKNTTVYYLPGTTGWGTNFLGRPTALWNPTIQTSAGLRIQNGQFGFTVTGTTSIPVVIETTSDLTGGVWTPLQSCTLTNGSIQFSDPQTGNYPQRFYGIGFP